MSLIELMAATTIAIVGAMGFVATANVAASNSAISHRRTLDTMFRSSLLERSAILSRTTLSLTIPQSTWLVWACYDFDGQPLGSNAAYLTTYTCPVGTMYQTWLWTAQEAGAYVSTWRVSVYAERTDAPCTNLADPTRAARYSSKYCVAGDTYLTD